MQCHYSTGSVRSSPPTFIRCLRHRRPSGRASPAARCVACHGVRSHAVPVVRRCAFCAATLAKYCCSSTLPAWAAHRDAEGPERATGENPIDCIVRHMNLDPGSL